MDIFSQRPKIQIISRYCPAENRTGPFTYLFDVMRYLRETGCTLELVLLDQWFMEENIPGVVRDIADVRILQENTASTENSHRETRNAKSWLRPFYSRLPVHVLALLRKTWYGFQSKQIPGHHAHDAFATPKEIEFTARRCAAFQPDVLILNHTYLGNVFEIPSLQYHPALKVILTHHIEHKRTEAFEQARFNSRDSAWTREKEAQLLQHADLLLAIQKDDASILQKMAPHKEILCTPMSATVHIHDRSEQVAGRCLFVGSDIEHNVYGLQWFLQYVWPKVLHDMPNVHLHVCGTVGTKITKGPRNVKLLGRVEHIENEYGAAEVCVIPLIAGSGLKIKLVEALSHSRACVSTSVGVQGVRELDGKAILVKDRPEDFAAAVIKVLQDSVLRESLEKKAQQYVIERLSPEQSYQPLLERIYRHTARNLEEKETI
ncbi:MAG: glycosyltransferase family 4 protein [bacterium]|nr:glycosyltransferase family 4 protein [bacterium]